jgi:cyclopropane fatty-acyl-phospholipid synthase-like methyltransferase
VLVHLRVVWRFRYSFREWSTVLDLCCGWGELLLRLVEAHPAATGTGVDNSGAHLARARAESIRRGLHKRVELVEEDAAAFADHGDIVVCVGGAHAFNGTRGALEALADRLAPGGILLFGDAFWAAEPSDAAREIFGELETWDSLLETASRAGYAINQAESSTTDEWDAFERAWASGPLAADDAAVHAAAEERVRQYHKVYLGVLGFAWLRLTRRRADQPRRPAAVGAP